MSNQKINKLIAEIKDLKVSELLEVVRGLTTSEQNSPEQPEQPERPLKTEYTVILVDPGERKIEVIKVIRELTGLGLKEAKALVDSAPSFVKKGVTRREADSFIRQLKNAGANVKLQ